RQRRRRPTFPTDAGAEREGTATRSKRLLVCAAAAVQPAERVEYQCLGPGIAHPSVHRNSLRKALRGVLEARSADRDEGGFEQCPLQIPEVAALTPEALQLVRQLLQPPQVAQLERGQLEAVHGAPDDGRLARLAGKPERPLPQFEPAVELEQMRRDH